MGARTIPPWLGFLLLIALVIIVAVPAWWPGDWPRRWGAIALGVWGVALLVAWFAFEGPDIPRRDPANIQRDED
jgi:energy-coupling factor transporter transmembrane protein EcfT